MHKQACFGRADGVNFSACHSTRLTHRFQEQAAQIGVIDISLRSS
jgi:hypothetical protein